MASKPTLTDMIGKVSAKIDAGSILPAPPTDTDHSKIAAAITRITAAGFSVTLHPGDKLIVSPRAKLSEAQVAWITANKPAILAYLRSHTENSDVQALQDQFSARIQSVAIGTTPEPESPQNWRIVSCKTCLHGQRFMPGDEYGQWRLCEAGLGSHYALARRECDGFVRIGAH